MKKPPRDLPPRFCFSCGGNANEPHHDQKCDGKQGHIEAHLPPVPAPAWRSPVASTPAEERAETERDIGRVERKAGEVVRAFLLACVEIVARKHPEFTTEDVWLYIETLDKDQVPPMHDHRVMGPVIRVALMVERWITPREGSAQQYEKAEQMSHGRPLRVWRSLIYQG